MAFRFVHTADVHLDSPLRSLAMRDPEVAELIGSATREAFQGIIDLCIHEDVDALLIAGDLYDGNLRSMKTAVFFGAQMQRLNEQGINVFIVRGNHDAESVITRHLSLPNNVHVFTGRAETVTLDEFGVAIHGISYGRPQAPESLVPKFKSPVANLWNIGMLHTSLAGAEGHDTYSPCSVADLQNQGYDYWALGHVHKRQVHATTPRTVVMPGNPQGRHIGEAGPKSVTLVSLADDKELSVEERPSSVAQFERISVDATTLTDWADAVDAMEMRLREIRGTTTSPHLVTRIEFLGQTPIAALLRRDADVILAEARQAAAHLDGTFVESVTIDVHVPAADAIEATQNPLSELRTLISNELQDSPSLHDEVHEFVTEFQRQLPPELRDGLGKTDPEIQILIARLIAEGSEDVIARLEESPATES